MTGAMAWEQRGVLARGCCSLIVGVVLSCWASAPNCGRVGKLQKLLGLGAAGWGGFQAAGPDQQRQE